MSVVLAALLSLSACANRICEDNRQAQLSKNASEMEMKRLHEQQSIWNTDLADDSRFLCDFKLNANEKAVAKKFARTVVANLSTSDFYVHYLLTRLKEENLPIELAAIPMVESGLNPHVKPNGGAHGAWQYMRSTANTLGLKRTGNYDGIYDFFACTEASLKYFKHLYEDLGQWDLVAAAYNQGEYGVKKAMAAVAATGVKPTIDNVKIARGARQYVTKIKAFSDVMRHPSEYGVTLPLIKNRSAFKRVDVAGKVHTLNEAARLSGAPIDTLRKLNSGYTGDRIDEHHGLLLPVEQAEVLEDVLSVTTAEVRRANSK